MVLVKPTARWLGKTQRIPRGRKIERNGLRGAIDVTDFEARYLLNQFFVVMADETEDPPVAPPINPAEEESTEEIPAEEIPAEPAEVTPPADIPPEPETLPTEETLVLDYLNATEPEAIAQQIKGIGRKTADELAAARPLSWDEVNEILSDRQLETLVAFVKSHD